MCKQKTIHKELECECCGNIFPIWRRRCKNKNKGHKKHLYCIVCMRVTAHIELDEFRDNLTTYINNNDRLVNV
jgi:hypothetical protein